MAYVETLPLLLKQLSLPMMLLHFEQKQQEAIDNNDSHALYLAKLAELEINARYEKRIARYAKEAKLPPGKTLASFDFNIAPSINKQQCLALADTTAWVKQAHNLVLFGPSGVGKTHLAAAIGYRMIEQGIRCLFTQTNELVQKMQAAKQLFKLPELLTRLSKYPLLILDDIGYVKKDETETSVLFELIANRYENSSLIITANQPFSQWNNIFPDNMMAVAAIDRLIHHACIINIQENSFRQSQAKIKHQLNQNNKEDIIL
jgi:DNA replication protein DnaC